MLINILVVALMLQFPVRVYYEDTDAGGLVYYANYLKFAERARTEFLRDAAIEQMQLIETDGIGFVVRKCSIDYFKPAKLDDLLTIKTYLNDITKATIAMRQTIMRGQEKLVELEVFLAVISMKNGRVSRMPERVFAAIKDTLKHHPK